MTIKHRLVLVVVLALVVIVAAQPRSQPFSWRRALGRLSGQIGPEETAQEVLKAWNSPNTYHWNTKAFSASKASVTESCELIHVPLTYEVPTPDWATRANLSLSLCSFMKRDSTVRPTRQVWMVPGGPGETAKTVRDAAFAAVNQFDADVYLLDFRGVGLSTPQILCPNTIVSAGLTQNSNEDAWHQCGQEILKILANYSSNPEKMLKSFNTENAARDYDYIIRLVNSRPSAVRQKVWLAGYSYGTFLVNRIVYMFPSIAEGVLLDGVMIGPEATTFVTDYDLAGDFVFHNLFQSCGQDQFCKNKITSPSFGEDVMRALMNGHCKEFTTQFISVSNFQVIVRYVMIQTFPVREMIPMLMYRIKRCDPYLDGDFLTNIFTVFGGIYNGIAGKNPDAMESMKFRNLVLGGYIMVNELIDKTTPTDQLIERFQSSALGIGLSISSFRGKVFPALPAKYNDPNGAVLAGNYPNSTVKSVIFITGGLDSQTPAKIAAVRFADTFMQASERYSHVSPMRAHINSFGGPTGPTNPCAFGIAGAFIRADGSAAAAASFEKNSEECRNIVWFDYQASTLRQSQMGEGFGVSKLQDFWDGTLSTGLPPAAIILIVVGVILVAVGVIIVVSHLISKRRLRADRSETATLEADGDNPYKPLDD